MRERRAAAAALLSDFELEAELREGAHVDGTEEGGGGGDGGDAVANPFNEAYASWPFRWWVLGSAAVLHKPMPRGACYDLRELERCLETLVRSRKQQEVAGQPAPGRSSSQE